MPRFPTRSAIFVDATALTKTNTISDRRGRDRATSANPNQRHFASTIIFFALIHFGSNPNDFSNSIAVVILMDSGSNRDDSRNKFCSVVAVMIIQFVLNAGSK